MECNDLGVVCCDVEDSVIGAVRFYVEENVLGGV